MNLGHRGPKNKSWRNLRGIRGSQRETCAGHFRPELANACVLNMVSDKTFRTPVWKFGVFPPSVASLLIKGSIIHPATLTAYYQTPTVTRVVGGTPGGSITDIAA